MEEHVDYEKCNGKRARKLPSIFRSPFLVQYSHLMIGKEKERNRILDYAFCLELDGEYVMSCYFSLLCVIVCSFNLFIKSFSCTLFHDL